MAPVRGTRSARDAVMWECKKGHKNEPKRCLLFDVPTLECECGCGEKFNDDFEFCMGDIKINGHEVLGNPMPQTGGNCVAFAYAKAMEISKRMKEILQGKDPSSVPVMKAMDLVQKYNKIIDKDNCTGLKKVVHMAQILKEQGIRSEISCKKLVTVYKVSDVSTIKRNDHEAIALELARGYPLHAGTLYGKKLRVLKFCQSYKPPPRAKFFEKKMKLKAHAIVLVGAGRKKRRWFFFFLNSWKSFCVRRDSNGMVLRYGIGKIWADQLSRNVVRLSRFKESGSNRSLERQNEPEVSAHNRRLLLKSQD